MIFIDVVNPRINKYDYSKLYVNSIKKVYNFKYLDRFIEEIVLDVCYYFKNNFNYFLLLNDLLNDITNSYVDIEYNKSKFKVNNNITLNTINFYCKNEEKEWYGKLLKKYNFSNKNLFDCFSKGDKIKVKNKHLILQINLLNLIFFKNFFKDGIYKKLILNHDNVLVKIKKINNKDINNKKKDLLVELKEKIKDKKHEDILELFVNRIKMRSEDKNILKLENKNNKIIKNLTYNQNLEINEKNNKDTRTFSNDIENLNYKNSIIFALKNKLLITLSYSFFTFIFYYETYFHNNYDEIFYNSTYF